MKRRRPSSSVEALVTRARFAWQQAATSWRSGSVAYAYLGDGLGVRRTRRGHKLLVDTRDLGLAPHIIADGYWEPAIEFLALAFTPPAGVVVEVGCNVGYHTLALLSKLRRGGRLYGFEPNPRIFELLHHNVRINGFDDRAILSNVAVLDRTETVSFRCDPSGAGGGHVSVPGAPDPSPVEFTVPAVRLDDALADVAAVDLLRIDAEGSEPLILAGAGAVLARSPQTVILMEWSTAMMSWRQPLDAFIGTLDRDGMKAWLVRRRGVLERIPLADLANLPHSDVVLSRRDL